MATLAVSRSVAIIGAGAGGLAASKELQREGHAPVVFEQSQTLGGVWVLDDNTERVCSSKFHGSSGSTALKPAYCSCVLQSQTLGGVWVLDDNTESDPLGRDPLRCKVHSSMYVNLRTNLPREVMSYGNLPFHPQAMAAVAGGARSSTASTNGTSSNGINGHSSNGTRQRAPQQSDRDFMQCASVDPRRYCSHEEVLRYLRAYALYHDLPHLIQFGTEVLQVTPETPHALDPQGHSQQQGQPQGQQQGNGAGESAQPPVQWRVTTRHAQRGVEQRCFDAVVVCSGHYSFPNLPDVPGMDEFPRARQMHSHNYRAPEAFANQTVLVVGASNSGEDISRELSAVASRVLLSAHDWKEGQLQGSAQEPGGVGRNLYRVPMVQRLTAEGCALFPGGREEHVDTVIYATGYRYEFPMFTDGKEVAAECAQQGAALSGLGGVRTHGRWVEPLYLHLFPATHLAPWCSFLGIPWKIIPFPQMELQARLVARALSGRVALPSPEQMQAQEAARVKALLEAGAPIRYLHNQNVTQFAYNHELERLIGDDVPPLPKWREEMYITSGKLKRSHPEYRDALWPESDTLQRMQTDIAAQLQGMQQQVHEPSLPVDAAPLAAAPAATSCL